MGERKEGGGGREEGNRGRERQEGERRERGTPMQIISAVGIQAIFVFARFQRRVQCVPRIDAARCKEKRVVKMNIYCYWKIYNIQKI